MFEGYERLTFISADCSAPQFGERIHAFTICVN
jgi:hypothetical protein